MLEEHSSLQIDPGLICNVAVLYPLGLSIKPRKMKNNLLFKIQKFCATDKVTKTARWC